MKKYRKILILAVAALVLLGTASAQSAPAETHAVTLSQLWEQAAEGWHETYEAFGRTVTVDIPVQVPQTDAFPALTAVEMPPSGSAPFNDGDEMLTAGSESFANATGEFRVDTPSMETIQAAARQANPQGYSRRMDIKVNLVTLNEMDWDAAYSYNNTATVRQTDDLMADMLSRFFPDGDIRLTPHWVYARSGVYLYDKRTDTFSGDPWPDFYPPLIVYYDQVIGGIPLLGTAAGSFYSFTGDTRAKEKNYVGGVAIIQELADIGLTDSYCSLQAQLLKPTATLAEDLPLCGFDKVLDTYETLIKAGKLRTVDSLRLGYMAWQNGECFTLLPVWAAEGELFQTAEAEYAVQPTQNSSRPVEYRMILVNAQTGEWIDPWNGEENSQGFVPALLTWVNAE